MNDQKLKVGDLAGRTGLSVRTLHHYDDIGLLVPESRTTSGHRLYDVREVLRLQQIQSLRTLGFGLDQIRDCLDGTGYTLRDVVSLHLDALDAHIERQRGLRQQLAWLQDHLERSHTVSLDELIDTVEATTMMKKYYTADQLQELAARKDIVGDERIEEVQNEWGSLIPRVQAAMDRGAAVEDADVAALATEWRTLTQDTVAGFTGGDPALRESLHTMWKEEPGAWDRFGMSPELVAFISNAVAALDR